MPARRKRRQTYLKVKHNPKRGVRLVFWLAVIFLFIIGYKLVQEKSDKISLIYPGSDQVNVTVFDFQRETITTITIPGSTRVVLADGLGEWKIDNVWQIGVNEELDGQLLKDTVIKNFHFPVTHWADHTASAFTGSSATELTSAVFTGTKTDLGLIKKIKIAKLALFTKNTNRQVVNLATTTFIRPEEFVDGTKGYKIGDDVPEKLLIYFSDPNFALVKTILVTNKTGEGGSKVVDQLVSFLGNKVALIQSGEVEDINCRLVTNNKELVTTLIQVLKCEVVERKDVEFDVEIIIGKKFL